VKHFANQLQEGGPHSDLGQRLSAYQRTVDSMGLTDYFVDMQGRAPLRGWWRLVLELVIFGILSLPGTLLLSPVWLLGSWTFSKTVRKGKVSFGSLSGKAADDVQRYLGKRGVENLVPETITRHRANFDTINDKYMTFGFVWLCLLLCVSCMAVSHGTGHVGTGVALSSMVLPALIWLAIRCLDSGSAVFREMRCLISLSSISNDSLFRLCVVRANLMELVTQLPHAPAVGDESDVLPRMPLWDRWHLTGRSEKGPYGWQEHFGPRVDTTHMGQNEDFRKRLPASDNQLTAHLLSK